MVRYGAYIFQDFEGSVLELTFNPRRTLDAVQYSCIGFFLLLLSLLLLLLLFIFDTCYIHLTSLGAVPTTLQ